MTTRQRNEMAVTFPVLQPTVSVSYVFYLLLPLKGLAERFQQLADPDFIRQRQIRGKPFPSFISRTREDEPEPDFSIRSWPITFTFGSHFSPGGQQVSAPQFLEVMRRIEAAGHQHVAESINTKFGGASIRGLYIQLGFPAESGASQRIELTIEQNLQGLLGGDEHLLVVCHYPWYSKTVEERNALPAIMMLRKVVQLLQPDFGWHATWEWVCDSWKIEDQTSDAAATPLWHEPEPWLTYWRACVFGPRLQQAFHMESITRGPEGIFNSWRDGDMLWFRSPQGFNIEYGALGIEVKDPSGTWWMQVDHQDLHDALDLAEERHEQALMRLFDNPPGMLA